MRPFEAAELGVRAMNTFMPHHLLKTLSPRQLLQFTGDVIDELSLRKINRTGNNPLSDYSEWLVKERYGWNLAPLSQQGYDLEDPKTKERYEIKARRITKGHTRRQLSAIRDIAGRHFDFLISLIYDSSFEVIEAKKIPWAVVSTYKVSSHTNGVILVANSSLFSKPGVVDITPDFIGYQP